MQSRIPNPISWCWARGVRSQSPKSGSWVCWLPRPPTPLPPSPPTFPRTPHGDPEDRRPGCAQVARARAEARGRRGLILAWVVEHHGTRGTGAQLEQKVRQLATRRGTPGGEGRATLEKAKRLRDQERGLTED